MREPTVRPMPKTKFDSLFQDLTPEDQNSLLAFAEFLHQRGGGASLPDTAVVVEPEPIPRPDDESVVTALKRLSKTYPMLGRKLLFDQTSGMMMKHVMQGIPASDVIDELEDMFRAQYDKWVMQIKDTSETP